MRSVSDRFHISDDVWEDAGAKRNFTHFDDDDNTDSDDTGIVWNSHLMWREAECSPYRRERFKKE